MPRYFFHVLSPTERIEDLEGVDLADHDAARREAIGGLRSIIAEDVRGGVLGLDEWIEVFDASGVRLLLVRSGEALRLAVLGDSKEDLRVQFRPRH